MEDTLIIVHGEGMIEVPVYGRNGEWAITPPLVRFGCGYVTGDTYCITHAPTGFLLCNVTSMDTAQVLLRELPARTDLGMYPPMDAEERDAMQAAHKHSALAPKMREFLRTHRDIGDIL